MAFPKGIFSDALAMKGVLYAKLKIGGSATSGGAGRGTTPPGDGYLHVFNTHLQSSYEPHLGITPQYIESREVREVQIASLVQFISAKIGRSAAPAVLCGDFNVNARPSAAFDGPTFLREPNMIRSGEYMALMAALTASDVFYPIDLLLHAVGEDTMHPVTYADVLPTASPDTPTPRHEPGTPREAEPGLLESRVLPPPAWPEQDAPEVGSTTIRAADTVLTALEERGSRQALDYIFLLQRPANLARKGGRLRPPQWQGNSEGGASDEEAGAGQSAGTHVEKFLVRSTIPPTLLDRFAGLSHISDHPAVANTTLTQLSDHYGIRSTLEYEPPRRKDAK